ncbi:hypothetical protein R69919_04151 [Paraburkholderia gardini]|nr:hypothetical protein R69919_04151 [Paraburkholderia gardini]
MQNLDALDRYDAPLPVLGHKRERIELEKSCHTVQIGRDRSMRESGVQSVRRITRDVLTARDFSLGSRWKAKLGAPANMIKMATSAGLGDGVTRTRGPECHMSRVTHVRPDHEPGQISVTGRLNGNITARGMRSPEAVQCGSMALHAHNVPTVTSAPDADVYRTATGKIELEPDRIGLFGAQAGGQYDV